MATSIDVAIRVRPFLENEKRRNAKSSSLKLDLERNEIKIFSDDRQNFKLFKFDKVCDETYDQDTFYNKIQISNYVDRVLDGYHATIFCYGQTGAGKTYTMDGFEYDLQPKERAPSSHKPNKIKGIKEEGIIPRVIKELYKKIENLSKKYDRTYTICCSFLEIYNEKIYDLLNPDQVNRMANEAPGLKIRWNKKDQFVVENLYVFTCSNADEAQFLFQVGMKNKTMASHRLNNASSRSHTIFEVRLEYYNNSNPEDVIVSKLELVDLAGSERASLIREDGRVTKETIDINKSLFTLRQVINIISENQNQQKQSHIPYRDSKLTALLKQSIGGNAYCLMIACLSPSDDNFDENISTLTYATKVTKIQNEPVKNDDPKMKMINNLKIENNSLLEKLNAANERILHLTQKMKKGGAELTGGDETNREEKIEIKKPSKVNVSNGNDDLVLTDFEHHADSRMLDINNQSNAEDKYITEELVEAINQIRYLLGSLKQEREKNEFLSIQNEKQETLVSQLMRENQELRDKIEYLELSRNEPRYRSRSPMNQSPMNTQYPSANSTAINYRKQSRETNRDIFGIVSTPQAEDNQQQRRFEGGNGNNYTTMSTLHPDHEPLKGLVSPQNNYNNPFESQVQSIKETVNTSITAGNPGTNNSTDLENHFRTTTHFARNTIYRKFANANYNGPVQGSYENIDGNMSSKNDFESSLLNSSIGGSINPSAPPRGRNKSEINNQAINIDDAYNSNKVLMPKLNNSMRNASEQGKKKVPPSGSNSKASVQNNKIFLLKDITGNINPVIHYPKKNSREGKSLNNSYL